MQSNPQIAVSCASAFPSGWCTALLRLARPVNVQTTERYYAPWDRSRRDRVARIVLGAHKRDPLLAELSGIPARSPARAARFRLRAQAHDFR